MLLAAPAGAKTLTYKQARPLAQKTANRFAGQRTRIMSLERPVLSWVRHRLYIYFARAEWNYTDPTGCKGCVYDETTGTFADGPRNVSCDVTIVVRYKTINARRPVAFVDGSSCI